MKRVQIINVRKMGGSRVLYPPPDPRLSVTPRFLGSERDEKRCVRSGYNVHGSPNLLSLSFLIRVHYIRSHSSLPFHSRAECNVSEMR